MQNRKFSYAIKVFEAQWDNLHEVSVRPFFEQLKHDTQNLDARRRGKPRKGLGHNALFSYRIFENAEGLKDVLDLYHHGIGRRAKIAYFACHGGPKEICAIQDISRTQLKNILRHRSYDGLFFGACDFVNSETATQLLDAAPSCKWVAGYDKWIPWLESMVCDLMFFRLLLSGRFMRPAVNARWDPIETPQEAAMTLYEDFPVAGDLGFSLFYRTRAGIRSTLEAYESKIMIETST